MGRKRILIFISSLVIFFIIQQFCVVYAATALDTELVTNGSGETESISGWTDDTGQSRWSSSTMSALFTASPADGSHYFFLYNPSMASLSGSMSQVITLSGTEGSGLFSSISNGTVSIKFSISMFQAISTGNEAKAVLEEYDASGALIKSSEVVNTTASGSTMGSYQINTQVNPNTRKFKIILSASLTRGGYDLFDKVSLQLVDASAGSAPVFGNDFPASAETDQNITYGPVPFTISDADPGDIDKLTFSASSTNINVIPVSNISFGGSGANRTITIVPVSGLSGEADITVSASDGTKSSEKTFHFTVHKVISMNTNLVENGNAASGFEKWSGSNVNITATGNGFRIISQGYGMSQNIDISKFSALINGGETEFQMSAAFSAANGNVSAQFYSDIACTKPIDNSKYLVNNSTASLQQNIPVNAKGVAISFIDTVGYDPITIQNISFKIINDFPKISAISAQTTNLSQLTVPVNAYYTTSSATLTATSSNQMVVPNSGITIGGSGFNQTVTFTPLTNGNITINLTLSDGTKSTSASFSVTALEPASVSGVVSPTSGIYTEGSNLDFTVHFNHDIQGGEDSRLPLNIGGNSVYMSYLSSTANSITYRYTIGSTDSGTVAIGSAIDDSSSPIKDTAGYAALKTINDSMKMTGITVVQAPVVSSPAGSYTYGDKITFTATLCTNSLTGTIQFKANGNNIGTPITVSGNTATYETTETELDAGTVSITAEYVPSDANVYFTSLTSIDYNITINKKTVSIDGLSAASKVYDGTRDVSLTGGTINGVLNGDKLTANIPTSGLASQKNAGTQAVTFDTILLDGADKDNYSLSVQPSVSVNITPKSVTPSATAANKEYDGKTETTVQFSFATGDIVTGDDITVSAIGTFADANVGTGKEVTLSNFTMDGADKNNYDIGMPGGLKADISPRGIEVTPDPVTKVYGQPDTALTYKITSGSVVAGESLKGNLLRVVGENAGEYEITQGTLTNANNPNYDIKLVKGQKLTITQETPTITVSVNKSVQKTGRDVVVTATLNYPNKQDDDAYPATVAFTATNAVSKGAVTVNGNIYSQTFTMGNDLTKDATFNAEVGANGNYKDASSTKSATVSIIERYTPDVAVSSNIASNNATYGTAVTLIATVSDSNGTPKGKVQFYVDGIVYGSETTLAADGTAKISTAAAPLKAGDRNITAQYLSADGETDYWSNSSSNYLFIVDKKPVSIVGLTAVTKVYDGTTQVDLTGGTISGVLTGDTLNVNIPVTGSVLTKTAEAGKAVSFTTIVLSGADKDNYELNSQPTVTATITARPITAAAVVSSKVYDGTTDSVVVLSFNKTDLIGSDQLTATVSAAFTDMNTGTGKAVSLSNLVTGGSDCDNYKVNLPTNLTADISPLSIEITPDLLTKVYGQTDPAFTYHVTKGSLVSGDALNGSLSRESGEDTGNFAIKQGTLTSANNTNYSISFVSGAVLAITQATPAIVVTSNKTSGSAIYGDAVTFTTTVSGTGGTPKGSVQFKLDGTAIGSETALINGTASLATAKTQLSAGNYSITVQYLPATDEIN
ncbi:MAG: YDG domain-containing protein, partial [Bacillota bacterium]|nr:YDG domain-containing protein [Bacillota bacterium]